MTISTKGWYFESGGYPDDLKFGDIPFKAEPGPHELLVRVKAAALNPVDIQIMNLPFWSYVPGFLAPQKKSIARDFAGIVEAAGSETTWKKGDEIFGFALGVVTGTLQELTIVDTKSAAVAPKPSAWSWTQAAALPLVYLTARTTIESVDPWLTSNKKLIILGGSSAVGMYAAHLAATRGWHVVASCSASKAAFVRSMGATETIDYNQPSSPTTTAGGLDGAMPPGATLAQRIAAWAPAAIIDCVGGTECLGLAPRYVTIVGDKTSRASMGGAAIYLTHPAMVLRHLLGYLGVAKSYACVNLLAENRWLEETLGLPVDKIVVDSEFAFASAPEAYERLNTGRAKGKVVVRVDS